MPVEFNSYICSSDFGTLDMADVKPAEGAPAITAWLQCVIALGSEVSMKVEDLYWLHASQ